jgi:putative salt-induced outer membrane protein
MPFSAAAEEADGWSGEASLSAGYTSGNSEATDVGASMDLANKNGLWTYNIEANFDYGEQDSIESRNRVFVAGSVDRQVSDKAFAFTRASYEVDQFTGFDSRSFLGLGLGYHVFDSEKLTWTVRGGPGVKIDEVKRVITTDAVGAALIIPAETETSFGAVGRSEFSYAFNDNVKLSDATDIIYSGESTQMRNIIALTAALSEKISARMSFDVRYDTNPPDGFESTDTATKIALVYGF